MQLVVRPISPSTTNNSLLFARYDRCNNSLRLRASAGRLRAKQPNRRQLCTLYALWVARIKNVHKLQMRAVVRLLQAQYEKTLSYEKQHREQRPANMPRSQQSGDEAASTAESTFASSPLTCDSSQRISSLLNALRYTTKHANDATTPKALRQALGINTNN